MGLFTREEPKPKDMSLDSGKAAFIEKQIAEDKKANHVPMQVIAPVGVPPLSVEEWKADLEKNKNKDKVIESPTTTEADMVKPIKITITMKIKNRKLLVEMIDGISEVIEEYGDDAIDEFKILRSDNA
jgi:hypothetical protein